MSEAKWYVVHTYSGYENKVKANIDKTIENRHLEDQILEVRVPMQEVIRVEETVFKKRVQKKMFPGYVMIHMVMNDDTWYVVQKYSRSDRLCRSGIKTGSARRKHEMAKSGHPAEIMLSWISESAIWLSYLAEHGKAQWELCRA